MARLTARDLITQALRSCGVIGIEDTPSPEMTGYALDVLNNKVEEWNINSLWPYTTLYTDGTLIPNQDTYEVNLGETINAERPNYVDAFAIYIDEIYRPLVKISPDTYDKSYRSDTAAQYPQFFTYRNDYPNGTIQLYPKPSDALSYRMVSKVITPSYTLNSDIDLPMGYYPAIQSGVAYQVALEQGLPQVDRLKMDYDMKLATVKRLNEKPRELSKRGTPMKLTQYDIYSDTYGGR